MLDAKSEVLVDKIDLPTDIRRGQPFEARIVVSNYSDPELGTDESPTEGKIRVTVKRSVKRRKRFCSKQEVTSRGREERLPASTLPSNNPHPMSTKPSSFPPAKMTMGFGRTTARPLTPTCAGKDESYFIEDSNPEREGDFDLLINRLRESNIEIVTQKNDQLFGSLAELQAYDAVILAGVPRGFRVTTKTRSFLSPTSRFEMLVRNTEQLGCGPVDDRRTGGIRCRWLDGNRTRKGHAGRLQDQEREGAGCWRAWR